MSAIGQFAAGVGAQSGRNVVLEPWRDNTRSPSGVRRAGEITADALFIGGGVAVGAGAAHAARGLFRAIPASVVGGSGPVMTGVKLLGLGVVAGAGVLGAATGIKNLFAKLPADGGAPQPPMTTPPPSKPTGPDAGAPIPPKADRPAAPQLTHDVRPGETLNFIADCNDVDWRDLYSYNRDVIGPNPDDLFVGQRLAIPPSDYRGDAFSYVPTREPGHLPDGLQCVPAHPAPC